MQTLADDRIAIRLNKKMAKRIKNLVFKENRNLSEVIRQWIHEYLKKHNG